ISTVIASRFAVMKNALRVQRRFASRTGTHCATHRASHRFHTKESYETSIENRGSFVEHASASPAGNHARQRQRTYPADCGYVAWPDAVSGRCELDHAVNYAAGGDDAR